MAESAEEKSATKKSAAKKATKKVASKTASKSAEPKVAKKAATKKAAKKAPAKSAVESKAVKTAAIPVPLFQAPEPVAKETKSAAATKTAAKAPAKKATSTAAKKTTAGSKTPVEKESTRTTGDAGPDESESESQRRRRRRRGGRGRRKPGTGSTTEEGIEEASEVADEQSDATHRRRRRRRGADGEFQDGEIVEEDGVKTVIRVREPRAKVEEDMRGSTRLEAKKQRRRDTRDGARRRAPIITESEFLARRESVERKMLVRQTGDRTQIAVLEDGILVEHYVNRSSNTSYVGNVYLGRVQNVLPSMEAAFVDIGKGRNAVLYAGEVNWDDAGLADGEPKRIETALKSGQPVLVQVTKDPIGHKGARLTSQISLPGRYLVYVPGGGMSGISRKLPDTERTRLKQILKGLVPEDAGVIVRTAAEGASEDELTRDVARLKAQWEDIERKTKNASAPSLLYGEPDLTVRVIRDIFNEDFTEMVIEGAEAWDEVHGYLGHVAPDLVTKLSKWTGTRDLFGESRIDEQLSKALDRKVWLPSGGSLVIDRTEAMIVVDVNTGKFTGKGGNLEETVTKNNLEAAEEIARQLRLRDLGGIIVIDFIDMVLESNRDAVLRRLMECLGRDRTKHQVAEVTSLGLVQMTRKRVGQGLLEAFSTTCESCHGRGVHVHLTPVEQKESRHERHLESVPRSEESVRTEPKAAKRAKKAMKPAGEIQAVPEPVEVAPVEVESVEVEPTPPTEVEALLPQAPILELTPEDASIDEIDLSSTEEGAAQPVLRVHKGSAGKPRRRRR
jgi:ribonuclease E